MDPLWAQQLSKPELLQVCAALNIPLNASQSANLTRAELIQKCDYLNRYPTLRNDRNTLMGKCLAADPDRSVESLSTDELVDCIVRARYAKMSRQLGLGSNSPNLPDISGTYAARNRRETQLLFQTLGILDPDISDFFIRWIVAIQTDLESRINLQLFRVFPEESNLSMFETDLPNIANRAIVELQARGVNLSKYIVHQSATVRLIVIFIQNLFTYWSREIVSEIAHEKTTKYAALSWSEVLQHYGIGADENVFTSDLLELAWDSLDSVLRGREFERLWTTVQNFALAVLTFGLERFFSIPIIGPLVRSVVGPLIQTITLCVRDSLRITSLLYLQRRFANHDQVHIVFHLLDLPESLIENQFADCQTLTPFEPKICKKI